MEEKTMSNRYGIHAIFMSVMISLSFLNCVRSEVLTVGDDQGRDIEANYGDWSRKHSFSVGDVLAFNYLKGQHNVYEVTEETYRSCDASTGVLAKYESGNDLIQLSEARNYWFICTLPGHCLGGMRFGINVKEKGSRDVASLNPGPVTTSLANSRVSHTIERWSFCVYLLTIGILLRLYG